MQTRGSRWRQILPGVVLVLGFTLIFGAPARADGGSGWQAADTVQKALQRAQVALLSGDRAEAEASVVAARQAYTTQLAPLAREHASDALAAGEAALAQAADSLKQNNEAAFVAAGGSLQAALYHVGYEQTMAALDRGDVDAAKQWLLLREFRAVSRFERLNSDATQALLDLRAKKIDAATARAIVQTDLLDTYQARLNVELHDLRTSDQRNLAAGRAQHATLTAGYWEILAPIYREQRDDAATATAQQAFNALRDQAAAGKSVATLLPNIDAALRGFRAAPLSVAEQNRRAGQLLRFVSLVSVEYARGVKSGMVTVPLEIQEAATFRDGAAAAFADLQSLLDAKDPTRTQQTADAFVTLERQLREAKDGSHIAPASEIQASTDNITALLKATMPAAWQKQDTSADFDVISASLDQMERAVKAGEYTQAESARLEAYAILESGPEAKLVVFAPELKLPIESLFWYGGGQEAGLASLIQRQAPPASVAASRQALNVQLQLAEKTLAGTNNAPIAVASNAAVIVFREGLEAVLILASLMGSLKIGTQRTLRKPLWGGVVVALIASALTWVLAQELLTTLARYGERLEAVVSVIAIAILLLITNWFFHDVYWTGWMANFHRQKKRIIGGTAGQALGLVLLGFTSIYREGFETVLFLQALVLQSGTRTVLGGVAIGLALTMLIGLLVFGVQAKLPHKKMLIFTGLMICFVLVQMVGNTAHVLQLVGWLPLHPIRGLASVMPYWAGMWLGFYATWEGILLQILAGAFTIGSYFAAEYLHKREIRAASARYAMQSGSTPRPSLTSASEGRSH